MRSLRNNSWRQGLLRSRSTPGVNKCPHQGAFTRFSSGGGADQDHPSPTPPPPPPLAFLDVPYFEGEGACGEKHLLDVYIPSTPFPRPRARTCLFVHGGSWQRGDRRHPAVPDQFYGNVGRAFAAHGLVGLVMSYRLAPGVQHPEQVRDVARAIRWVRDNASRYGGDGGDIVVVGHSAGAHLAALCLADGRWLAEEGVIASPAPPRGGAGSIASAVGTPAGGGDDASARPPSRGLLSFSAPSSPVSGFVGISGVYDIPRMAGNVVGGVLARAAFGNDRRTWQRVSPVHCVRATTATRSSGGAGHHGFSSPADPAAGFSGRSGETAETSSGGTRVPATTVGTGASTGSPCPLLHTEVLLLTAGTDFHLEDDAEALVEALDHARLRSLPDNPAGAGAGGGRGGGDDAGRQGRKGKREGAVVKDGLGQNPRRQDGRSAAAGTSDEPVGGDEGRSGHGSVRHVRLEGEDHLSVMVSFGEPGAQAAKAVMGFILGIRKP